MVRVGVFGANHKGERHIQAIAEIPGCELMGIYDPDHPTAKRVSELFNIPLFTSPDVLSISCDAIVFELPLEHHFDLLSRLLTLSKHLLVNYPVSLPLEKINHLNKLAREANVILQISNHERLNPVLQSLIPFIKKPMFMEIRRGYDPAEGEVDEESLKAALVRDIDLALHLVKSNVQRINATGIRLVDDLMDLVNARLEFDNGCVVTLTSNRYAESTGMDCTLFQREEWFSMDFVQQLFTRYQLKHPQYSDQPAGEKDPGKSPVEVTIISPPPEDRLKELTVFKDAIVHQSTPLVDMEEAYFAVKILLEMMEKITKKV
jgi:predicted dehydrogenase